MLSSNNLEQWKIPQNDSTFDIQYRQPESFFNLMFARIYVGYGTSSLGLTVDPSQPGPTWAISGTPGSPLENAFPLPGAMMNHFVMQSNWYDDGSDSPDEDNNVTGYFR